MANMGKMILKYCHASANGCLEWHGEFGKIDGMPVLKIGTAISDVRKFLFKKQFPGRHGHVDNLCGNQNCISPHHASSRRHVNAIFKAMGKFQVVGGDQCYTLKNWQGGNQHATFTLSGHTLYAHQELYQIFLGIVPNGMEIHHLCGNKACINLEHFELRWQSLKSGYRN